MMECMRRETIERERLQAENTHLTREKTSMAQEIERLNNEVAVIAEEKVIA